ncbi:MAG TPA: PAS domain-containing protein [Rhizomicrobium sp.]|jgi:hypothetical protein
MKHRNSHLLVGYWSRLRRGRQTPDQADIDPRAIKRMLSHVFILDARDAARPAYRLAGTTLCDRFGLELRGMSFFAHWEAGARGTVQSLLQQSLAARQPVSIASIGVTSECAMVEMETVLAPLTFGAGAPTRFLGMVQWMGDIGALAARPVSYQRLVGSQMIREDDAASFPLDPPPPTAFDPIQATAKTPHLRLVVSREKAPTLHFGVDCAMQEIVNALEIVARPPVSIVR